MNLSNDIILKKESCFEDWLPRRTFLLRSQRMFLLWLRTSSRHYLLCGIHLSKQIKCKFERKSRNMRLLLKCFEGKSLRIMDESLILMRLKSQKTKLIHDIESKTIAFNQKKSLRNRCLKQNRKKFQHLSASKDTYHKQINSMLWVQKQLICLIRTQKQSLTQRRRRELHMSTVWSHLIKRTLSCSKSIRLQSRIFG